MKKNLIAIAGAGLLIAGVFGVDAMLRRGQPDDRLSQSPVEAALNAPTTGAALTANDVEQSIKHALEGPPDSIGARLLALDESLDKSNLTDRAQRKLRVLDLIRENAPEDPAAAEAALRAMSFALLRRQDSRFESATNDFIQAAQRIGLYENGVTSAMQTRALRMAAKNPAQLEKLNALFAAPEKTGSPSVREMIAFRVGMALQSESFSAAPKLDRKLVYRRRNLTAKSITEELKWSDATRGPWLIEPDTQRVVLAPGEEKKVEFQFQYDHNRGDFVPFPVLYSVASLQGQQDLSQHERVPMDSRGYLLGRVAKAVRTKSAPKIDGKLDDVAWVACKPTGQLLSFDGYTFVRESTVSFCFDDKGLYVAARFAEEDIPHIRCVETRRDGLVWRDDGIELMLNPKPEQADYFHFMTNFKNVQYDGINLDPAPNFSWQSAVAVESATNSKGWVIELGFTWAELGVEEAPKPDTRMWLQIVRNRYRGPGENNELMQWSPAFMFHNHQPDRYGTLEFE